METIESKKRYKRMFVAVVLCISLLIGSAFALSPSYQKVNMPDPYGIMPLSLSEETTTRTVTNSSAITYGFYSSSKRVTYSAGTRTFSTFSGRVTLSSSHFTSARGRYMNVPAGTYYDIIAGVSYTPVDYQSIVISGGYQFYLYVSPAGTDDFYAYPDTCQILINGVPVGDVYSCSSGSVTIPDVEFSLTENVTSLGLRFTWSSADSVSSSSGTTYDEGYVYLYARVTDSVNITPVTKEDVDYIPFLNRIISWEQSIYSGISALGDSLGSSLGGAIEKVAYQLSPENEGTVGESVSNLGSIFAREDDIKLRDDMDSTLKEATSSFWSPAGEGETETEFDKATKVDKQKVTDIKNVGKGASALFDTGYGITDGFEAIATDDSFMSWFTAETANALDSTGQAVSVGDDDPYNMHFYYDQMQAIQKARGDD